MSLDQALASERELLVSLCGGDGGDTGGLETGGPSASSSNRAAATEALSPRSSGQLSSANQEIKTSALLDHVFESICRPLKVGDLPYLAVG